MNKGLISKGLKKLSAALAAAVLLVGTGSVTSDVFVNAADTYYDITLIETNGAGAMGSVNMNGQNATITTDTSGRRIATLKFKAGTRVDININAANGYQLSGVWTNANGTGVPVTYQNHITIESLNRYQTYYPKFKSNANYYSFSSTAVDNRGTITGTANGTYKESTQVSVTAKANSGYEFAGWSESKGGAIISTGTTYTTSLYKSLNLYANFVAYYGVSAIITEGCSGISGTDVYHYTVGGCTKFKEGTSITLTANAKSGYTFAGWYENSSFSGNPVSKSQTYTFKASKHVTLYPKFTKNGVNYYRVKVVKGKGCKSVLQVATFSNHNQFSFATYPQGTHFELIALEKSGYKFVGWWTNSSFSGNPISTDYIYSMTVSNNITLYPKFVKA